VNERRRQNDRYPRVVFRKGALAKEIDARGESPNLVAKQDLKRYYDLLRTVLPRFTESEARALLQVLEDWGAAGSARPLDIFWSVRSAAISSWRDGAGRRGGGRAGRGGRAGGEAGRAGREVGEAGRGGRTAPDWNNRGELADLDHLANRLRDLHPSESLAIVDALERALHLVSSGTDAGEALRHVGLLQGAERAVRKRGPVRRSSSAP
jgi:hypothetical protein